MATGLRIIALTEPEYQQLLLMLAEYLITYEGEHTALMRTTREHVDAAVYHPVPVKAYEVARTDQQHNIKRTRNR